MNESLDTTPGRDLAGKTVIVTGGSRGLGRRMVEAFASNGANVVIASRNVDSCTTVARHVTADHGVRCLPVGANVSDWADCDRLVSEAVSEFGRIDVLVNNAGVSPLYPSLTEVTRALFDKVIGVNLAGPFRLMAVVGEHMQTAGGGSIVNIGSIEAIRPHASALPYAAAKAGLHVLTEGFAQALGPGVRVNTIQPGPFLTDISDHWPAGMRQDFEDSVALRRCGDPDEIIEAAIYSASSASSYATGAVLRLDGGWR